MRRFGAPDMEMREMGDKDLFFQRLHLLVIMSKAYLQGMPIGDHRRKAIIENAHHLFYQSLHTLPDNEQQTTPKNNEIETEPSQEMSPEYIFHQRVQLLAIMAKAFAEGRSMGEFKKKAMKENLEYICSAITFTDKVDDMEFLKVA